MAALLLLLQGVLATTSASSADPTHDRRVAAFVGGMVADAAAMPLHWIYDTNEIAEILKAAVSEYFAPKLVYLHIFFTCIYSESELCSFLL